MPDRCVSMAIVAGLVPTCGCGEAELSTRVAPTPLVEAPAHNTTGPSVAPPPAESPAARDPKAFADAMERGRAFHRRDNHRAAVVEFERALAIQPMDARAHSELGWALLAAGDDGRAKVVLERAIELAGDRPGILGEAYYNLGRVLEHQQDREAAVQMYNESLRVRPRRLDKRIRRLGGQVVRRHFGPNLRATTGPFKSLRALCRSWSESTSGRCATRRSSGKFALASVSLPDVENLPAPLEDVALVMGPGPHGTADMHAAFRTPEGWFALVQLSRSPYGDGDDGPVQVRVSIPGGMAGSALEVEVKTRWRDVERSTGMVETEDYTSVYLCGVGPSRRPSCTGELPRASTFRRVSRRGEALGSRTKSPPRSAWTVALAFPQTGTFELTGEADEIGEQAQGVLGTHKLAFW